MDYYCNSYKNYAILYYDTCLIDLSIWSVFLHYIDGYYRIRILNFVYYIDLCIGLQVNVDIL